MARRGDRGHDADRLGHGEVEVGPDTGFAPPSVWPACPPSPRTRRRGRSTARPRRGRATEARSALLVSIISASR
jgi:hypothetical protein